MTSKRNITSHVKRAFGASATYREYSPDVLGWPHAHIEASECQINAQGKTIGEARRKIAALLESVSSRNAPDFCVVDPRHLDTLVLGYVRYAMVRMSTAPSTASEIVKVYWHALSEERRAQVLREVSEDLARCERSGSQLGMQCDHDTWTQLVEWMRKGRT